MRTNIYTKNEIGRTPDDVAFLALALNAAKVLFPVVGALMEPTIPGHVVNIQIKEWDLINKFTGNAMGIGQKLLAVEPNSYRYTVRYMA